MAGTGTTSGSSSGSTQTKPENGGKVSGGGTTVSTGGNGWTLGDPFSTFTPAPA